MRRLTVPESAVEAARAGMALVDDGHLPVAATSDLMFGRAVASGDVDAELAGMLAARMDELEAAVVTERARGLWSPTSAAYPTRTMVSWGLLGGDPAREWVTTVLAEHETARRARASFAAQRVAEMAADADDSAMLALVPADPEALAVPGGEPAEQLHVTLCYAGRLPLSPAAVDALHAAAADAAAAYEPFEVRVSGVATIGDPERPATVLLVESDTLVELHEAIQPWVAAYDASEHPAWLPHLTVGYGDAIDAEALESRIGDRFEIAAIRVAIGEEVTDHPLTGQTEEEPMDEDVLEDAEAATGSADTNDTAGQADAERDVEPDALYALGDDGRWEGILVVEGLPSGDGRMILEGALTWRDLPLPLMAQLRNPDGGDGHDAAVLAGRIETIERRGNEIWGSGRLDLGSSVGREVRRLLAEGFMRGVSVDLDLVEADLTDIESGGGMVVLAGRIMGATIVPFPAFEEAMVWLVEEASGDVVDGPEEALVASGGVARAWTPWDRPALVASAGVAPPVAPPKEWFEPPTTEELLALRASGRALHISDEGRIYGVAAIFGTQHIAVPGARPPRSRSRYAYFQTGEVHCADGTVVSTGPMVLGTYHPDLTLPPSDAQAFYADTGAAFADVSVHEVRAGREEMIVFAGALRPGIDPVTLRTIRASDGISPDWRRIGGRLELVAMLLVNTSGFKVPALAASAGDSDRRVGDELAERRLLRAGRMAMRYGDRGEVVALVAAGAPRPSRDVAVAQLSAQVRQLRTELGELRAAVRPLRAERAARVLAEACQAGS